jgi:nitric oxide reductase large subunit
MLGTGAAWFYFGHSGYEYIDPGRLWQIALLAGLFLWLAPMVRAILPALRQPGDQRPLLVILLISSAAIAMFYMAALGYGRRTNLAIVEYWRWWVVHLWVEGFSEVFATIVIAFLFARLKLVAMRTAAYASVLSATILLSGGIVGTLHHLTFSGTPIVVIALGSVFSALEVVPLLFMGLRSVGEPSNPSRHVAVHELEVAGAHMKRKHSRCAESRIDARQHLAAAEQKAGIAAISLDKRGALRLRRPTILVGYLLSSP